MQTDDLVEHLASYGIQHLPSDELQVELDFAKQERALSENQNYRGYMSNRIAALTKEQERRVLLKEGIKASPVTVEFIRDLKARVDIRDIFNDVLGILVVPSGTDREKYQCPSHPDWNPSGYIYVKDQTYHCFQCGAHGDVFDCLMAFKGLGFLQAVDAVAGYLGVELPKPKRGATGKGCVAL